MLTFIASSSASTGAAVGWTLGWGGWVGGFCIGCMPSLQAKHAFESCVHELTFHPSPLHPAAMQSCWTFGRNSSRTSGGSRSCGPRASGAPTELGRRRVHASLAL